MELKKNNKTEEGTAMKKAMLLFVGMALLGTGVVFARQGKDGHQQCGAYYKAKQDKHIQKHVKKLTKKLNLTDQQQTSLESILRKKSEMKGEIKKEMYGKFTSIQEEPKRHCPFFAGEKGRGARNPWILSTLTPKGGPAVNRPSPMPKSQQ